jgi:predicted nucleic acid-binding protein
VNVLVVDTSAWIAYFKNAEMPMLDVALREGRVYLPPIVLAELLSAPRLKAGERARLEAFLLELPLCVASFEHWKRVGELRAKCAGRGLHLSTPDSHVAQCAIDLDGYLMTSDRIFEKVADHSSLRLT